MTDDHVGQARVIGFALTREPEPADQMLFQGDESLAEPPVRPVPSPDDPSASIRRTGPPPVYSLAPGSLHQPAADFGEAFQQHLTTLAEAGDFIRSLLRTITVRQHLAWLVGGAVRDLLAIGPRAPIKDLDFTGTIGPGELSKIAPLRREDAGDYEWRISPRLVWSVTAPEAPDERIAEYKPLARTGLRFPAWGGDLRGDAKTRDLTINSLYYDPGRNIVADPTSRGLADLHSTPTIAATPFQGDDPSEQACIILRCLKFRLRWPDLDTTRMAKWAGTLPEDLVTRIPACGWKPLLSLRDRCVPESFRGRDELSIAVELGPAAVRLIEEIRNRDGTAGKTVS